MAYIRWSNLFVCLRLPSRETPGWHFSRSSLSPPSVPPVVLPTSTTPSHTPQCMQAVSALGRNYLFHHPPNCPRANQRKFCSTGHSILFIYFRKSHRNRGVCVITMWLHFDVLWSPNQDTVLICVSTARGEMPNALLVFFLFSNLRDMHGHIL